MDVTDKTITCIGCKKDFTHGVEDQKRHLELGYSQEPKRCPECRAARKNRAAERKANPVPSQEVGATGDFAAPHRDKREKGGSRGGRRQGRGAFGGGGGWGGQERAPRPGGFGGGFGGGGSGGGFSTGPRQSFDAVCAACGVKTTVPFEPTQGREVFCRDCFRKR